MNAYEAMQISAAADYLSTPEGGWPETEQAYRRLEDECWGYDVAREEIRDRISAACEAAIAAGCYVRPSRRAEVRS